MKHALLLLSMLFSVYLTAQVNNNSAFFDPQHDPVALRSDTSIQLLVSEYVLSKSVEARLGHGCQVVKTYKNRTASGAQTLVFEGIYQAKSNQKFCLEIPLKPDAQARFYFASRQALVCSSPGCNNCSILNGNCVGCCSEAGGGAVSLPSPLAKIQTSIKE
ncbi:MAG: hypothetical protein IPH31_12415 [Lewinellaceae bacterium]|nr:hypothetical protein [Lewinellaceae bacterium]